jgi:hypothetical protein
MKDKIENEFSEISDNESFLNRNKLTPNSNSVSNYNVQLFKNAKSPIVEKNIFIIE